VGWTGNYVFEEIMNSLTHGLGFVASVVGTIQLMSVAAGPGTTPYHFWSCMIFSLSLMILYLSSTLYHRCEPF
jgi:hemolysin III